LPNGDISPLRGQHKSERNYYRLRVQNISYNISLDRKWNNYICNRCW